jgi:hypothetical protein
MEQLAPRLSFWIAYHPEWKNGGVALAGDRKALAKALRQAPSAA